ncbi:hypothetical protein SJ322_25575, partial [Serratia marcescens]
AHRPPNFSRNSARCALVSLPTLHLPSSVTGPAIPGVSCLDFAAKVLSAAKHLSTAAAANVNS